MMNQIYIKEKRSFDESDAGVSYRDKDSTIAINDYGLSEEEAGRRLTNTDSTNWRRKTKILS